MCYNLSDGLFEIRFCHGWIRKIMKVNDYVVYPLHGVGILREIETNEDNEKIYKIELEEVGMTISIPDKSVKDMGLRNIIKKEELDEIVASFAEQPTCNEENWRVRFRNNIQKLKSGDPRQLADLVKELFVRNKKKSLSIIERKQFENAFQMLIKEVTIATRSSEEEVNSFLSSKLDCLVAEKEKEK